MKNIHVPCITAKFVITEKKTNMRLLDGVKDPVNSMKLSCQWHSHFPYQLFRLLSQNCKKVLNVIVYVDYPGHRTLYWW